MFHVDLSQMQRFLPVRLGNLAVLSWIWNLKLSSKIIFLVVSGRDLPAYYLFDVLLLLVLIVYGEKSELNRND